MYFLKFVLYEIATLVAVAIVFRLTDKFLGGNFQDYGSNVLDYYKDRKISEGWVEPMCNVFPTLVIICSTVTETKSISYYFEH